MIKALSLILIIGSFLLVEILLIIFISWFTIIDPIIRLIM
jgi:hypothetical protein